MSKPEGPRELWVPEDHIFNSASECMAKFKDQAATLLYGTECYRLIKAERDALKVRLDGYQSLKCTQCGDELYPLATVQRIEELEAKAAEYEAALEFYLDYFDGKEPYLDKGKRAREVLEKWKK